jgi:hypothetical protein
LLDNVQNALSQNQPSVHLLKILKKLGKMRPQENGGDGQCGEENRPNAAAAAEQPPQFLFPDPWLAIRHMEIKLVLVGVLWLIIYYIYKILFNY